MKLLLTFSLFCFLFFEAFSQNTQCDKCDLRYLNYVNSNFKNLSETIVERFLCSLDYNCSLNPNFVNASTKTIYAILETKPALVIVCLTKYHHLNKKYILELIKNTRVKEDFDLAYNKVRSVADSSQVKNQLSSSIKIAALRYKIKL